MEIRPLREEELPAIARVYLRAYPEPWSEEGAVAYLGKFRGFEPDSCLVGIDGGAIAGAVFAFSYQKQQNLVVYIQELFVDPDRQHRGVGKKLVSALRSSFTQNPRIKVKPMVKADTKVLNFYNSLGFDSEKLFTFFDE